jgi:hypothetical protein
VVYFHVPKISGGLIFVSLFVVMEVEMDELQTELSEESTVGKWERKLLSFSRHIYFLITVLVDMIKSMT